MTLLESPELLEQAEQAESAIDSGRKRKSSKSESPDYEELEHSFPHQPNENSDPKKPGDPRKPPEPKKTAPEPENDESSEDKDEDDKLKELEKEDNAESAPSVESTALVKSRIITFNDIAGQPEAVEAAKMLAEQLRYPERFEEWGVECPRGIMFTGPSGTGKTLLAKALAGECHVPFKLIKCSDIISKWYGQSTQNTKAVFMELRKIMDKWKMKHGIIYFDEVDALANSRQGSNSHEESRRFLSEVLQQLDGFDTKRGIIVIASTNDLKAIDPAFSSRMDMIIDVPLPNTEGLAAIMKLHFGYACELARRNLLANDVDFLRIAEKLNGYSGRDIENIVKTTLRIKARNDFKNRNPMLEPIPPQITQQDILEGIQQSGKAEIVRDARNMTRKKVGFVLDEPHVDSGLKKIPVKA